jgi:hypothetical protein
MCLYRHIRIKPFRSWKQRGYVQNPFKDALSIQYVPKTVQTQVEKDMMLHRLLGSLQESFRSDFLFKGGTCLIKVYLGYYRFSEDLTLPGVNRASSAKCPRNRYVHTCLA